MFNRIFAELAGEAGEPDTIMILATHLKAHRTAASLLKGGLYPVLRDYDPPDHCLILELSGAPKGEAVQPMRGIGEHRT